MEKIIVANHKMYIDSLEKIKEYKKQLQNYKDKIIVLPSFLYLNEFSNSNFIFGAQNISENDNGAFTGEISAKGVKNLNGKYALIGHSEVRTKLGETSAQINNKIKIALKNDLKVILCIGETKHQHENGQAKEIIKNQILEDLKNINQEVIIAYEPIWSIGTGLTPTNDDIITRVKYIKSLFNYKVKVLYGGSVSPKNIDILNKIEDLDGYLIGKASTDAKQMIKILEVVK